MKLKCLLLCVLILCGISNTVCSETISDLIAQGYESVLQRKAEAFGLVYWSNEIEKQRLSLSEFYVKLFTCPEYKTTNKISNRRDLIRSLYNIALKRGTSDAEIDLWYYTPYSDDDVVRMFVASKLGIFQSISVDEDVFGFGFQNTAINSTPAILAFLALVKNKAAFLPGVYNLDTILDIGNTSNLLITTVEMESSTGQPCLYRPDDKRCAVFKGGKENLNGPLIKGKENKSIEFRYVAVDGNIDERREGNNSYWDFTIGLSSRRNDQSNLILENCDYCKFNGFGSTNAVAASGMIIWGKYCVFDNSIFKDNGHGLNKYSYFGRWADGLTVVSGENIKITNSYFIDNSDIDLVVSNTKNGIISNNTFSNKDNWCFAALSLITFYNNAHRSLENCVVSNNKINCNGGMCGFGITVGHYFWGTLDYNNEPLWPMEGGEVKNNTVDGARQGISSMGAKGTIFSNNEITNSGNWKMSNGRITSRFDKTKGDSITVIPSQTVTTGRIIERLNFDKDDYQNLNVIFNAEKLQ